MVIDDPVTDSAIGDARRIVEGFGLTLRRAREAAEISLRELAAELGLDGLGAAELSKIENARLIPTPDQERTLRQWVLQHSETGATPDA